MKRVVAYFFTIFLTLLIAQPVLAEKRVALVIGNSAYKHTVPLANPKNDAKALTTVLKRLGFEVLGGTDLTHRQFVRSVVNFSRKLRRADVGLFFYAGHGLQVSGQNYLVPIDAELSDEADLQFAMVKLNDVLVQMERSSKTNLIFIDACRDNPLARSLARAMNRTRGGARSSAIGRGLASVRSGIGTMITFATEPGNVAQDGKGKNSPFTTALLKHIETPGLDIAPLLRSVRRDVIKATRSTQVPWNHSSLTDSFYFKEGRPSPRPQSKTSGTGRDRDLAYWQDIRGSKDAVDYEDYLQQFPKGTFARRAKRLKKKYEKKVAVGVFPAGQPVDPSRFSPGTIFDDCNGKGWCPSMVVVPSGNFMMGSKDGNNDEKPVHNVSIPRSFAVGRFEVTWDEWEACGNDDGCDTGAVKKAGGDEGWGKGKRPAINVSWHDAKFYVKWLSRKTGEAYRLLTEAEWEYVARGNKGVRRYWWGSGASREYANYGKDECCGGFASGKDKWKYTSPVGSFHENPFKVHDMHGNVWEWVEDCYQNSYNGPSINNSSKAAQKCASRVMRGGSWKYDPVSLRSSYRNSFPPDARYIDYGFRVARTLH